VQVEPSAGAVSLDGPPRCLGLGPPSLELEVGGQDTSRPDAGCLHPDLGQRQAAPECGHQHGHVTSLELDALDGEAIGSHHDRELANQVGLFVV
jgi:hypothetical protein